MITALIATVLGIFGTIGFFAGNESIVIIGAIANIVQTTIGFATGTLHSLITIIIAVLAGLIFAFCAQLPLLFGIAVGLCFEAAIMGVWGFGFLIYSIIKIKK